jgi:hypothetical protein
MDTKRPTLSIVSKRKKKEKDFIPLTPFKGGMNAGNILNCGYGQYYFPTNSVAKLSASDYYLTVNFLLIDKN